MTSTSIFVNLEMGTFIVKSTDESLPIIVEIGESPTGFPNTNIFLKGSERDLRNFHRLLGQAIEESWPRRK